MMIVNIVSAYIKIFIIFLFYSVRLKSLNSKKKNSKNTLTSLKVWTLWSEKNANILKYVVDIFSTARTFYWLFLTRNVIFLISLRNVSF